MEKPNASSGISTRSQTQSTKHKTSTPFNELRNSANLLAPPSQQYFLSPSNTSLINGTSASRLENVIDISSTSVNKSENANKIRSTSNILTMNVLGNNININNISNNSNNISGTSNIGSIEDGISYQRIKKIVTLNNEANDAKLKAKEQILNNLKSIDLTKYSFPNETKPRTDYTYARTSSYLQESKSANDNTEMPNLCRRGRKSPQSNSNPNTSCANTSSTSFSSTTITTTTAAALGANTVSVAGQVPTATAQSGGVYQYIKNLFIKKTTIIEERTNSRTNIPIITTSTFKTPATNRDLPLQRNLFRDDENADQAGTRAQTAGINPYLSSSDLQTLARSQETNEIRSNKKKSSSCCYRLFMFLLLCSVPFIIYGIYEFANTEKENNSIYLAYDKLNQVYIVPYIDINKDNIDLVRCYYMDFIKFSYDQLQKASKYFDYVIFDRMPTFYDYLQLSFKENLSKLQTYVQSKGTNPDVDYKPSRNFDFLNQEDFIRDLELTKETIFSDTISKMNSKKSFDIELLRKELDEKFNFSLTIMSNKLADQSMLFEMSKINYEKDIKQIRNVLDELQSRYNDILKQFQEQMSKNEKLRETLEQAQTSSQQIKDPSLRESFLDEKLSFEKIEEYINRTFYLYNADKTGIADFASESVGGSILFTRCTQTYEDNARWFTVFDFKITRVPTSPRVVIQGHIQPGNCWAFKGSKADLFIKLATKIKPSSFSLEHIPKELSITGNIDSAPQNFSVFGYENHENISDDNRILLGNYRYDNNSKHTLQFFSVQYNEDKPITAVELKIESNAGNKEYTCLYKFRVHGKLFKKEEKNQENNDQASNLKPIDSNQQHNTDQGNSASCN